MLGVMPKVNVYLPDRLAKAVRDHEVSLSGTCQVALEEAVRRAVLARLPVDTFTPRLHRVLELASDLSTRSGKNYVGVEHVQLAILDEGNSVPAEAIESLGVSEAMRAAIYNLLATSIPSNRLCGPGGVIGWIVGDPGRVVRLDGAVFQVENHDGELRATDEDGTSIEPIPIEDAPYVLDIDEGGRPFVVVDSEGRHTGRRSVRP